MNIPSKLIDTTIAEFKAEGYECTNSTCMTNADATGERQVVQLYFNKIEKAKDEVVTDES